MKAKIKGSKANDFTKKRRITFFVKSQMDDSISDIMMELATRFKVKKVVVTDLRQIDAEIDRTDICWFAWCDELVSYASKMEKANNKHIILWLHSYEAFTEYPAAVNWATVDIVIFETEHIRDFVLKTNERLPKEKTVLIAPGIDVNKYKFADRTPGFNIAYVGNIRYEQGSMLLLQVFKRIFDQDSRYKLYIAGVFQEPRYVLYFSQMLKEMGLEQNVFYQGHQQNIEGWLENKDYIISSSLIEGHQVSIMQGMAKGLKPLIHNFVGAKEFYPDKYIWNTVDDCIERLKESYNSQEYRDYIQEKYSLPGQIAQIKQLFNKNDRGHLVELQEQPLVTIGIVNYNGREYIEECVNSFIKQNYINLEIIIIDDKSNDGSQTKILKLKKKYPNIKTIFHDVNSGGMSKAIQEIIVNANGKYVQWIASDDFVADDSIRNFVNYMECNPAIDYVYSNFNVIDKTGNLKDQWVYQVYNQDEIIDRVFHTGSGLIPMVGLFRLNFFKKNKLSWIIYRDNDLYSDTLNCLHFIKHNLQYEHLNQFLFFYRVHDTNASHSINKRIKGAVAIFDYIIQNFSEKIYLPEISWMTYDNPNDAKLLILVQFYYSQFKSYMANIPSYVKKDANGAQDIEKNIIPFVEEIKKYIQQGLSQQNIYQKELLDLEKEINSNFIPKVNNDT